MCILRVERRLPELKTQTSCEVPMTEAIRKGTHIEATMNRDTQNIEM